jgi:hypothetical protein
MSGVMLEVSFTDVCQNVLRLPGNVSRTGAIMYVRHAKGDVLLCQQWTVCARAMAWGFAAVLDVPHESKPIGVSAATTWLVPAAPCNLTYLMADYNVASPSYPLQPDEMRFDAFVAPLFAANPYNVTLWLGPQSEVFNQWFGDCRPVGNFYQVWQWLFVALSAVGIVLLVLRVVFLVLELKSLGNVPVLACGFALLALFYQLLRDSVNPSNCYGAVRLWSSELDAFFFTADIPAVLSSLLLLAFYQLEVLQPKRLTAPVLDRLKLPCGIIIAALFAVQLIVVSVVQTGQDVGGGAVIVQAVIFLIFFVALLAFYLYATVRLFIAISKSPQLLRKRLFGPTFLAATSILSCFFAFAAAGIVLADSTYVSTTFVLLEVLSDLSTLSACMGIALVIKASPPKSKVRGRADTISKIGERLRSFSASREKSRESLGMARSVSPRESSSDFTIKPMTPSTEVSDKSVLPGGPTWESTTVEL